MIDNFIEGEENIFKGTRTEPRNKKASLIVLKSARVPLSELTQNKDSETGPNDVSSKVTLSEPVNKLKVRTRLLQDNFMKAEEKPGAKQTDSIKITSKVKTITAGLLAKILEFDTLIDDELGPDESDEKKLFAFLEKEGRLSPEILKEFRKSFQIRSINMTHSYAGIIDESGLLSEAKYTAALCTKPLFSGFQQLLSIDFTNVKITDDDLRYLIRLPKLQALGLSGTSISDKGLKYISIHSAFIKSLRCIKLCFIQGITDSGIKYLEPFVKLKNVDLRGNTNITLSGCLELIKSASFEQYSDITIRLPQSVQDRLEELHNHYKRLSCDNHVIILDPDDVRFETMTLAEMKSQLKWHKKMYPDIYLNQDLTFLKACVYSILKKRRKEEILYNCCLNG